MAHKVEEVKEKLNNSLSGEPWKSIFDLAEQKTGVPRLYIFLGKF